MSEGEEEVWLVRHGETEWSRSGQHTGTTDLPLTANGEKAAEALRPLLTSTPFDLVLCSPRQRARRTAELAGIADVHIEDELVEWDYGDYEGRRGSRSRRTDPAGRSGPTAPRAARLRTRSPEGSTR